MTLAIEDMRIAVDDARRRHEAIVKLIQETDKQALGFLQLYVTLSAAALTGAGVVFLSQPPNYPIPLGIGLLAFGVTIVFAAVLCLAALWSTDINLPGRDPDFWLWANSEGVSAQEAYRAYLTNLADKVRMNSALNLRVSREMTAARITGVAAPAVGLVAAGLTPLLRSLAGW